MNKDQPSTYPKHNCYEWTSEIWNNQPDASYITCGTCNRITHFRFKSIWKRIKFLFWDGVTSKKQHE